MRIWGNFAASTLASGITSTQTAITLAAGTGSRYPSPTGGDWFELTLAPATELIGSVREVSTIVGRSGDILTVGVPGNPAADVAGRGREGTTAASWSAGDKAEHRGTAQGLRDLESTIGSIDQSIFPATTLVAGIIYDTSSDSDGGAWRDRCSHTSWENETLSGNWLGSAANETAARAISGATTGSYYYDTTAALFKSLNAGSGTTTVYRGNVRKFPARVAVTVETARVILWDLTQAGVPMWMVFAGASNNLWSYNNGKAVAMLDGLLCISDGTYDLYLANFVSDSALRYSTAGISGRYKAAIASRNSGSGHDASISAAIVNRACNSVAITALPNAPIDVATGLPVPTMAVGTAGGLSTIKDDGTVASIAGAGSYMAASDLIWRRDVLLANFGSVDGLQGEYFTVASPYTSKTTVVGGLEYSLTIPLRTTNYIEASSPIDSGFALGGRDYLAREFGGVDVFAFNDGTPAASMWDKITTRYSTGWMPGDIRLAALSDSTAETLTESGELVTNGDFPTDTTGWTATNSTLSVDTARLKITNSTTAIGYGHQQITTVVGQSYSLRVGVEAGTSTTGLCVGNSFNGAELYDNTFAGSQTVAVQFTATSTTTYITLRTTTSVSGDYAFFDNISCKLADPDQCVKGNGLTVKGSITKAAVASGAQAVGYSGWSAANYLERAYDADFDFSTGTFWIGGWLKMAANSAIETLLERDSFSTAQRFTVAVDASGMLTFTCDDNSTTRTATGTVAVDNGVWRFVSFSYSAGTLTIKVNGASYASATGSALLTLNNASAVLDIGKDVAGSYPATNATMALWRISATIPNTEQELHIYETEKALFQANAQCTLAGTSNAILAFGYDKDTDLLHAMTSYGRSTFKGLVRVASEATGVGTPKAVAASGGAILQLGSTSSDIYIPAYSLREEMTRLDEQTAAFGAPTQFFDFDATAAQTTFTLGVGWEIVAVYAASGAGSATLQREGSGKQWTRSFNGFKWSAVFASGRSASDWVSIEARRTVK